MAKSTFAKAAGLTLLVVCAALPAPAAGLVTLGPTSPGTSASFSASVVTMPDEEVFTTSDSPFPGGAYVTSAGEVELLNNEGEPLLTVDGYVAGRNYVVRNEGSFMRYLASATMDMTFTREAAAAAADLLFLEAGASASFSFEIIGEPMPVNLAHDFAAASGSVVHRTTKLSGPGGDLYFYEDPAPPMTGQALTHFSADLPPGVYTLTLVMSWESTLYNPGDVAFAFDLTVGEEADVVPPPVPGDHTHPDIFTERDGSGILETVGPQIVTETDLGDGTTELLVHTLVHNTGMAPWPTVRLDVAEVVADEPDLTVVTPAPVFSLGPQETTATGIAVTLRLATADLADGRATILNGSRFRLSGAQQAVFAYPVQPLEEDDFESSPLTSPNNTLTGFAFPYVPTIGSGTVWLEWEPHYREPLVTIVTPAEGGSPAAIVRVQGRDRMLPALVKDVTRIGTQFVVSLFDPDNLDGNPGSAPVPLPKVMKDGLVVTDLTFDDHPEDLGVTEIPESHTTGNGLALSGFFPSPVPFHFNNVEISPGIVVSGSLGFHPEVISVTLEMQNAALHILEVRADYQADCNLLLETGESADNGSEPVAGREVTLLDFPLLNINLPAGFNFEPHLVLSSGATINAPSSLSLPVTAGLDVSLSAGVRDGVPYYDSQFTPVPLHVSDPGLYEALGATAEAHIDCEIKGFIGGFAGGVRTGPTLGARASADFTITPLDDPWWSADAALTAFAGMELNLAGIVTLVDAEHDLQRWSLSPFFPRDAGGPLFPRVAVRSFDPQPGFPALGNPRTRWIRSVQPDASGLNGDACFGIQLAGSGDLVAGSGSFSDGLIVRLSPEGGLLWAMNPSVQLVGGHAVAEPDGGFTVLGVARYSVRLAKFDDTGAVVWKRQLSPPSGSVWGQSLDLVRRDDEGGGSEYFVLGQVSDHAALIKIDASGNQVWGKLYPVQPFASEGISATPGAVCVTSAGDLVVAGNSTVDLSDNPIEPANITRNGLVFKVDGDTGAVVWATVLGSRNTASYHAVSEAPDGSIYAGGNALPNVLSDLPSMLLTKLDADGQWIDSVLIGSGLGGETVPHGGETPFDTIHDMAWVDGQLWVCGQMGLYNAGGVGGVGAGASAFTAMISEKLDVSRFVVHAGPATDSFQDIEPTEDGLFVTGFSGSFHPWPGGATAEGQQNPGSLLALMLPWEGRTRFHLASAGHPPDNVFGTPAQGSFFITPRVRAVSQFTSDTYETLFAGPGQINLTEDRALPLTILAEDYLMSPADFPLAPTFIEPAEFKSLEFLPRSLITDLASYLQWHQIDAEDDQDGDGLTAREEFFLGTNTSGLNTGAIAFDYLIDETTFEPFVRYTLTRSKLAGNALPSVYSTAEPGHPEGFQFREEVSSSTEPFDDERDWLFLELPAPAPWQFYQLALPE
ncbi:MAG: PQQ-binding-like beta-propeller repeat protein [Verrucomicrobiales bacterium]|nr:PQQ-binding-like beta-propeller repeat protein [Verrucomicrobiales bacterium]